MNLKTILGAILTALGIIGLIYGAYSFIAVDSDWRKILAAFILGLIFFGSGIGLVKGIKEDD